MYSQCLFCASLCEPSFVVKDGKLKKRMGSSACDEAYHQIGTEDEFSIEDDLKALFIIDKLLNISTNQWKQYLVIRNGEFRPALWFSMCDHCDQVATQCWRYHQNISRLEKLMDNGKISLKLNVLKSKDSPANFNSNVIHALDEDRISFWSGIRNQSIIDSNVSQNTCDTTWNQLNISLNEIQPNVQDAINDKCVITDPFNQSYTAKTESPASPDKADNAMELDLDLSEDVEDSMDINLEKSNVPEPVQQGQYANNRSNNEPSVYLRGLPSLEDFTESHCGERTRSSTPTIDNPLPPAVPELLSAPPITSEPTPNKRMNSNGRESTENIPRSNPDVKLRLSVMLGFPKSATPIVIPSQEKAKRRRCIRKCKFCGQRFQSVAEYDKHITYLHVNFHEVGQNHFEHDAATGRYVCNYCGVRMKPAWLLKAHILTSHKDQTEWPCNNCGMMFGGPASLGAHRSTCLGTFNDARLRV